AVVSTRAPQLRHILVMTPPGPPNAAIEAHTDHTKTTPPATVLRAAAPDTPRMGGSAPISSWVTRASRESSPAMAAAAPRLAQRGPAPTLSSAPASALGPHHADACR